MMMLFEWFDSNYAWIYNNMCMFNSTFFNNVELPLGAAVLKCILMSIWYFMIFIAPFALVLRGVGYIIGSWTGLLPAAFIEGDD